MPDGVLPQLLPRTCGGGVRAADGGGVLLFTESPIPNP